MLADTIKTAREIIEKGWCKGRMNDGVGFCALGAVAEAVGVEWVRDIFNLPRPVFTFDSAEEWTRGKDFLNGLALQAGYKHTAVFNDDPITTHQDVLNFFDKALAELGAL